MNTDNRFVLFGVDWRFSAARSLFAAFSWSRISVAGGAPRVGWRRGPKAQRASASSRAMRFSVEGWVEKSRISAWPLNGWMMNMCAVAGEASMGIRLE